jgi:hypothetical protein
MLASVRWRLTFVGLLAWLAVPSTGSGQPVIPAGVVSSAYAAAVERYASGERDAAVAAAAAMSQRELRESVEALRTLGKRARGARHAATPVAAAGPGARRPDAPHGRLDPQRPGRGAGPAARVSGARALHALTDDPEWRGFAQRWTAG